jgi:sugar lactone lactonase YvrE
VLAEDEKIFIVKSICFHQQDTQAEYNQSDICLIHYGESIHEQRSKAMRKTFLLLSSMLLSSVLLTLRVSSALAVPLPSIIPLPDGFRPEGIARGRGDTVYAGSLGTGAIYRADLSTGEGAIVVPPQDGRVAAGLKFDSRTSFLFVAGGAGGAGYVYDAESGDTVAVYSFTDLGSFVNDVVVTPNAAYFTDSSQPVLYRVALEADGQLTDPGVSEIIPLGGDFVFVPDAFNTNGIEALPNGKTLIIVHSSRGELYTVNPETGDASLIDLGGGSVPSGDGILLDGRTLYVVQNFLNQISVVQLDSRLTTGVIETTLTDPDFDIPTTVAQFGDFLYAVNAKFTTPPTPDTPYEIVQVPK